MNKKINNPFANVLKRTTKLQPKALKILNALHGLTKA